MNQLRCFIASAFDRNDTDLFFSKVISPSLKALGIVARVVNRIEHNNNIDQKIIGLLKECDIAIADLTYARPSVYYEAGFAERSVPVIYTARKDHFRQKDDDPNGNLCIHFDLQKKNIIPWSVTSFPIAKRRLIKRIKYVIRPLLLHLEKQAEVKELNSAFELLSQQAKLTAIRNLFYASLLKMGYHSDSMAFGEPSPYSDFSRVQKNTLIVINSSFRFNATGKFLEQFAHPIRDSSDLPYRHRYADLETIKPRTIKRIRIVNFVFSLRKTPSSTLHDACSAYQVLSDPRHLFQIVPKHESKIDFAEQLHICLVDGFKNENEFVEQTTKFLKEIDKPEHSRIQNNRGGLTSRSS